MQVNIIVFRTVIECILVLWTKGYKGGDDLVGKE